MLDFRQLYDRFDLPLTACDCGEKCAPHNPTGKPFCCDICQAVPAAYHQEWEYQQRHSDLWHAWRGDECPEDSTDADSLRAEAPGHMLLLACQGPARCQRPFRLMSCRQFPFYPYITADDRFLGLVYDWEFESLCWVISNLGEVSSAYRQAFAEVYDELFFLLPGEYDSYVCLSEQIRAHFASQRRRIPLLHRNGGYYLLSPSSERLQWVEAGRLPHFGPYKI